MNTAMMPNTEGTYVSKKIERHDVDSCLVGFDVVSAIGHEGSDVLMSTAIGREVNVNRITVSLDDGDAILCFKLRTRPPEGKILTLDELNAIGFDLVFITYRNV